MIQFLSPAPLVLFSAVFWLLLAFWAVGGFLVAVMFAVLLDHVLQRIARTELALENRSSGEG